MSSYREVMQRAITLLEYEKIENASLDAWFLLESISHMNRTDFFLHGDNDMPKQEQESYLNLVKQRCNHQPIQYILGMQEFMGLSFRVNENVLIPRQDTEILVEQVMKKSGQKNILDVCTGSGCIAISLAKLSGCSSVDALDISGNALEVACYNAKLNQVSVTFFQSNMFEKVKKTYDIIVSNPPYIPSNEILTLMPEVKDYEPRLALDGANDGLAFYRILAEESRDYLTSDGSLFLEIGCEQGEDVCELLRKNGYDNINIIKDYAGLNRVICADIKK